MTIDAKIFKNKSDAEIIALVKSALSKDSATEEITEMARQLERLIIKVNGTCSIDCENELTKLVFGRESRTKEDKPTYSDFYNWVSRL